MSVIINGVTCEEMPADFEEGIDGGGPFGTKSYICDWANRYQLANGVLGLVTISGGVGGTITLPAPQRHPESPNMSAMTVLIRGAGRPTQGTKQIQWPKARVIVRYGVPPYGPLFYEDDPNGLQSIDPNNPFVFAEQTINFSLEQYVVPASATKLVGGGVIDKDITATFPRADLTITLHQLPYLPAKLIFSLTGKINNARFLGGDVGQMIFNGGQNQKADSTDGTYTQQMTYSFSYRTIAPWDKVFHPNGTSGWVKWTDKNDAAVIKSADLSLLFPTRYLATGIFNTA